MAPTNSPQQPVQPGILDKLLGFLFGRNQLQQVAGQSPVQNPNMGGSPLTNSITNSLMQPHPSQIFQDPSQNNTQMGAIVNAYMKQKAIQDAADAAAKSKRGKKKQPALDEDYE